jgi:hypothetical protein
MPTVQKNTRAKAPDTAPSKKKEIFFSTEERPGALIIVE